MLNMSEQEARRQLLMRQSPLQVIEQGSAYNTGSNATTAGAVEYINLCLLGRYLHVLSTGADERVNKQLRLHTYHLSSTGGGPDFQINAVKCLTRWGQMISDMATPAKLLASLRTTFMLSVQDAAAVLQVSRPTVYQWQTLEQMEQIRARRDRERLLTVYRLAKEWDSLGNLSGRWLTLPLERLGKTVLEILQDEVIDRDALIVAHHEIAALKYQLIQAENRAALQGVRAMRKSLGKLNDLERKRRERKDKS